MQQNCRGMGKRYVIALSLFLSAALSCHADEPRPTILFFFADDQRHDTPGCAGHKIVETRRSTRKQRSAIREHVCDPFDLLGDSDHDPDRLDLHIAKNGGLHRAGKGQRPRSLSQLRRRAKGVRPSLLRSMRHGQIDRRRGSTAIGGLCRRINKRYFPPAGYPSRLFSLTLQQQQTHRRWQQNSNQLIPAELFPVDPNGAVH